MFGNYNRKSRSCAFNVCMLQNQQQQQHSFKLYIVINVCATPSKEKKSRQPTANKGILNTVKMKMDESNAKHAMKEITKN